MVLYQCSCFGFDEQVHVWVATLQSRIGVLRKIDPDKKSMDTVFTDAEKDEAAAYEVESESVFCMLRTCAFEDDDNQVQYWVNQATKLAVIAAVWTCVAKDKKQIPCTIISHLMRTPIHDKRSLLDYWKTTLEQWSPKKH